MPIFTNEETEPERSDDRWKAVGEVKGQTQALSSKAQGLRHYLVPPPLNLKSRG